MSVRAAAVVLALLAGSVLPAAAIDHENLDENRPLRVEDPYPIATGEWALEAGGGRATFFLTTGFSFGF